MVIKLPWAGQGSRLLHAITAVEVGVELLAHLSHELRAHMTERRTRRSRKPAIVGKVLWTLPRRGSKCLQHGVRLSRGASGSPKLLAGCAPTRACADGARPVAAELRRKLVGRFT